MYAPADVDAGLACGCHCVGCGAILVAKKGTKKRWHFAHHNVEIGESCAESAIHAAAKQVLIEQNWLRLPREHVVILKYANRLSDCVAIECKGKEPGGALSLEEAQDWIRRLPTFCSHIRAGNQEAAVSFEL